MKLTTISFALAFVLAGSCIAQTVYAPYVNQRFTFAVEYPSQLFTPLGESENGDGQVFATKAGDAKLTVFGGWRGKDLDFPCEALETATNYSGASVIYKWKKGGASVASGSTRDGKIFYVKNVRSSDKCVTLMLEYPEDRRETFDPLVSRIAGSLRS